MALVWRGAERWRKVGIRSDARVGVTPSGDGATPCRTDRYFFERLHVRV